MGVEEVKERGNQRRRSRSRRMIFTYGTLKRGFSNHKLMLELIDSGDARFLGTCRTEDRYPLVCGPYRVPFLLNMPGRGHRVKGEAYEVSERGLARMDELEGTTRSHYERLPIRLCFDGDGDGDGDGEDDDDQDPEAEAEEAEAYFGHRNYAEDMWRRNGERGYVIYSEKEAKGYVKRNERPQHLTFLDHISLFLSSSPPPTNSS